MSRSVRKGSSDVDGAVLDLACCKQYFKQHRDGLNKSAPDGNCFDLPEQIFGVMQGRDRMALQDYFVELTGRSVTGWDSRGQIPALGAERSDAPGGVGPEAQQLLALRACGLLPALVHPAALGVSPGAGRR